MTASLMSAQETLVSHDVEGLLKRFQVGHAYYDGGGPTVLGDDNPRVLPFHLLHNFGQAVLHLG